MSRGSETRRGRTPQRARFRLPAHPAAALALAAALVFLYFPIAVLVLNSFNASRFGSTWDGWTLHWYRTLFGPSSREVWEALQRSLVVGLTASAVSMGIGTLAAWVLHHYRSRLQRLHLGLVYLPVVAPDILMGLSLAVLFVSVGAERGLGVVTVAHITFCISFVAMAVLARLQDFDHSVIDAARDLGASRWQAACRVVAPLLGPGILAGGLLAFTLSIDDFVITFFVKGAGGDTLPIRIYGMTKHAREMPVINALSTLLIAFTFAAVWWVQRLARRNATR